MASTTSGEKRGTRKRHQSFTLGQRGRSESAQDMTNRAAVNEHPDIPTAKTATVTMIATKRIVALST